jgi:methionyl-tRNA formyltransferase
VHGSILPKWRGAAPIQRSLEAGDKKTGITIMQMDKGLDTGDMILAAECAIENTDTSASLYEKLANLGPTALVDTLALMVQPNYQASDHNITQDNKLATYAKKLDKTEAELNWQLSAGELHRKVRAYIPWPVSQFTFTESESDPENKQHRLRVWQASVQVYQGNSDPGTIIKADKEGIEVATSDGSLRLEVIQLPGKKALPVKDILNGRSDWFVVGSNINKLG